MTDFRTWTNRVESGESWNEFNTLAQVVGARFGRVPYNGKWIGSNGQPPGRPSLERIAREHLGTAAVAILQGVANR